MTDEGDRPVELQTVEQLAVINEEVEPIAKCMNPIGIARCGARMPRRIDRVCAGETGNESAVGIEPPRPVQIDERRSPARDLNFGFDPVLP